jgi:DNA polymerase I-like protein with 3'-5' exonuclease and polymerase domains
LRVVACVAPESKMIAAYREGFDLHSITASSMAGMSLDDFMALKTADPALFNKLRTNGKAGNFGLLYGMSPEGFVAYAWANYGVKLTVEEATQLREAFLYDSWPGLPKYHDRIKGFAKQYGHVRSPLGRVRHLPHIYSRDGFTRSGAERQAINSPIQSTLSDMMLLAIAMVEDAFPGGEVEMVGMIHDSVFGYVPEENAAWWVEQVVNIMSNLPLTDLFGWKPQLLFPADGEMGPNLAQLKELEFDKVAA